MVKWFGGFMMGAGAAVAGMGLADDSGALFAIGLAVALFGLIITILSFMSPSTQSAGDGSNQPDSELNRKLDDYQ